MKELLNISMVENDKGEIDLIYEPNDGSEMDKLVQAIAVVRQRLKPPVPQEPTMLAGGQLPVSPMTGLSVLETFEHGPVMALRHHSLGWMYFQLPAELPEKLQQALSSRRDWANPSEKQ